MKVLLDTHVLLWWLFDDPSLGEPARRIIREPDNEIFVSSASAWEMSIKVQLGKLPQAREAVDNLPGLLRRSRMRELPIRLEHALAAGALPGLHRDPFDRMLIAQSRLQKLPLVTSDPVFTRYKLQLIPAQKSKKSE